MLISIIFLLLFGWSNEARLVFQTCGDSTRLRGVIVGGETLPRGTFPWLVAMLKLTDNQMKYFCGGSLITARHVLSAAHCIQPKSKTSDFKVCLPRDITVLLGAHDLTDPYEHDRQSVPVSSVTVHDLWNPHVTTFDYDIAMLELAVDATFSRFVQTICLWDYPETPTEQEGIVGGWGKADNSSKTNEDIPKQLRVPIHENEDCLREFPALIRITSKRTFCAGSTDESGVCFGDSGSGLVISHRNFFFLRGLVSSSIIRAGFCDVSKYAVYTDVLKFKKWINDIVGDDRIQGPPTATTTTRKPNIISKTEDCEIQCVDDYQCRAKHGSDSKCFFAGCSRLCFRVPEDQFPKFNGLSSYNFGNDDFHTTTEVPTYIKPLKWMAEKFGSMFS